MAFFGLLVIFLFVVDDSQLGVDKRVTWVDFFGFEKRQGGCFEVVRAEVLHSHVEMSLGASWEQSYDGAVDRHSLV